MTYHTGFTRKLLAGQPDVAPGVRVPMVYESYAVAPPTWEYRVLRVKQNAEDEHEASNLNELGEKGWLLVNVVEVRATAEMVYYFVRQKGA